MAGPGRLGTTAARYDDRRPPGDRRERQANHRRDPLRSTRPVRRAPRLVGRGRLGRRCSLVAIPFAPQVPGQLSAGGFILDDLESARAKALLETELGAPPSALVVVFSSPTLEAGTPAFEVGRGRGRSATSRRAPHVARVVSHLLAPRQVSADRHTAYDIVFLDLPPDDSPEGAADPARAAARGRRA